MTNRIYCVHCGAPTAPVCSRCRDASSLPSHPSPTSFFERLPRAVAEGYLTVSSVMGVLLGGGFGWVWGQQLGAGSFSGALGLMVGAYAGGILGMTVASFGITMLVGCMVWAWWRAG